MDIMKRKKKVEIKVPTKKGRKPKNPALIPNNLSLNMIGKKRKIMA